MKLYLVTILLMIASSAMAADSTSKNTKTQRNPANSSHNCGKITAFKISYYPHTDASARRLNGVEAEIVLTDKTVTTLDLGNDQFFSLANTAFNTGSQICYNLGDDGTIDNAIIGSPVNLK